MLLENHNAIESGGNYQIANSLRFQSASSQYLSRTPVSAGNRKTWTLSFWMKRGSMGVDATIFEARSATPWFAISFNPSNQINIGQTYGSSSAWFTAAVFRDPSAWYHVVAVVDTPSATSTISNGATDRIRLFVNGTQYALSGGTVPSQNADLQVNSTIAHGIAGNSGVGFFDGYLSEVNFIDGVSLTPSSFGEFDSLTGQWVAKKYTGVYGTNGFYLPFSNGTSTTTLGADSSGNSNNWTLTNFTRSPGTTDCWMNDVPSGNGLTGGNYAVMNPVVPTGWTAQKANLFGTITVASAYKILPSTITISSSKWYVEFTPTSFGSSDNLDMGIIGVSNALSGGNVGTYAIGQFATGYSYSGLGRYINNASIVATYSTLASNDILMMAVDLDANKIYFGKNGTWVNSGNPVAGTGNVGTISSGEYFVAMGANIGASTTCASNINTGQRSFAYTPPSGFKALCTANLPAATIKKGNQYMDATLYTGNATARSITNAAGFAPDMVWVKARSSATDNYIWDTVRGNFGIVTNSTATEFAGSQVVPNSTGFALENSSGVNANGASYVAWQWDAGSSTVTNTNGTISSQVRANPTAGVSVVTYTGNGTAGATVGHGLGVTPAMVIIKERSTTSAWSVWHKSFTFNEYIQLNTTGAKGTASGWFSANSNTFGFPTFYAGDLNDNGTTCVAYAFAEIAGFSKFGSYTGNGSTDGTFVYTGFRPKWIMIKQTSGAGQGWLIQDTSRDTYNVTGLDLLANSANAETNDTPVMDILSNGFKMRNTYGGFNSSGATYIYTCFAESPMAYANSR